MLVAMFDTVTVDTVPDNPPAVAGYVGGYWPTYDPLVSKFPNARHLSIAINAWEYAHSLDVETGDAVPSQCPGWVRDYFRGSGKPVLYTSASQVGAVESAMGSAGHSRNDYLIWSAHYTFSPHVCSPGVCGYPTADGTQWTDRALGRNLDESLVSDEFFGPVAPPDPHHYERYPVEPFTFAHGAGPWHRKLVLSERGIVQEYDKLMEATKPNSSQRWWINVRRMQIKVLRDRVMHVAKVVDPHPAPASFGTPQPSWDIAWRGWRWQKLNDRLRGKVKL